MYYTDDAVLITDNEDDLHRQLHTFNIVTRRFNLTISPEKIKYTVISKDPQRCTVELDNRIIEQIMTFHYLGVEVTRSRNIIKEKTSEQISKSEHMSLLLTLNKE